MAFPISLIRSVSNKKPSNQIMVRLQDRSSNSVLIKADSNVKDNLFSINVLKSIYGVLP